MTILRTGSNQKYSDGWEKAFGKGGRSSTAAGVSGSTKPKGASKAKKAVKKTASTSKIASAKKKPSAKKPTRKK